MYSIWYLSISIYIYIYIYIHMAKDKYVCCIASADSNRIQCIHSASASARYGDGNVMTLLVLASAPIWSVFVQLWEWPWRVAEGFSLVICPIYLSLWSMIWQGRSVGLHVGPKLGQVQVRTIHQKNPKDGSWNYSQAHKALFVTWLCEAQCPTWSLASSSYFPQKNH